MKTFNCYDLKQNVDGTYNASKILVDDPFCKTLPWIAEGMIFNCVGLVEINCESLKTLKGLPKAIQTLIIKNAYFLETTASIPESLKSLILENCFALKEVKENIKIKSVARFKNCYELESIIGISGRLEVLELVNTKIKRLKNKNLIVKSFICNNGDFETFEGDVLFNREIDLLDCEKIKSFKGIKGRFTVVNAKKCGITDLEGLPKKLESLNLSGCKDLKSLKNCPIVLERLVVSDTKIKTLEEINNGSSWSCYALELSGTKIKELTHLPINIENLFCNKTKLEKVENVPNSLIFLFVDGCKKLKTISLNKTFVSAKDCSALTDVKTQFNSTLSKCPSLKSVSYLKEKHKTLEVCRNCLNFGVEKDYYSCALSQSGFLKVEFFEKQEPPKNCKFMFEHEVNKEN